MKRKLRFLNLLVFELWFEKFTSHFHPLGFASLLFSRSWLVICILLLFSTSAITQEQTPPPDEFILGAAFSGKKERRSEPIYYETFDSSGMNSILQWAVNGPNGNKNLTQRFNLMAVNQDSLEWPGYYATCYYTKWEAEQNQTDLLRVGIKHPRGDTATWKNSLCWSTIDNTAHPERILIYGPHYRQDNRYKSWAHGENRYDVNYFVRYRMALDNPRNADPNLPVCKIRVIYSYRKYDSENQWGDSTCVFRERTITVGEFPEYGEFDYFYFDPATYKYPPRFQLPNYANKIDPSISEYPKYEDSRSYQGIQFIVEWLVTNPEESGLTLYVDNTEVYDRDWEEYLNPDTHGDVVEKIQTYAANFSDWSNIKYFLGMDEPYSIDAFTPTRIVDSLLEISQNPGLLTVFNPYWSWDNKINGDTLLYQFYRMANPEQLIVDIYPFAEWFPIARATDFEYLRYTFQECHTMQPGFWYMGQTFGELHMDGTPWVWRYPTNEELKASMMLALAHGCKGLFGWIYDSYVYAAYPHYTEKHYIKGLVDTLDNNQLNPTPHWYLLKDYLVPRLKGTLGKKLLPLNYTGDNLALRRYINEPNGPPNTPTTVHLLYLTLTEYSGDTPPPPINFHTGFFSKPNYPQDNYFMLDNLITTDERKVWVTLDPPIPGYDNYRFRNIEGIFDTTFNNNGITKLITYTAGEGFLYQVAPVVQYGGKLIFDETIASEKTLIDDMIIKNGKTLTVNTTYNFDRSITITEGGRIVTTNGGTLKFYEGSKLIVEGNATISGTSQNKLILDFISAEENGIVIKLGGSLTISNCQIKNAGTGILSELNANYLNAQNVEFINCEDYSIRMAGRSSGMNPLPSPQIYGCTMLNSNYGIFITNLPGMLIQHNTFTNTACGIFLTNVTDAQVIGNTIISNREEMAGIYFQSSGGAIRANLITGHTSGLHLANSSPVLGSNRITENKYHGLYIGLGSVPYMRRGQFIGSPPNYYATSGYNKIYENGGYMGMGSDNDGSEIYFYFSTAVMDTGCNSIYDNRQPSPPLVNTLLLMNGYRFGFPALQAQYNFWGDTVYAARFGSLSVNYIPYDSTPCPEPGGGEDELVLMTQFGNVIDTVYSTGDEVTGLSATEFAYAEAEGYFLTGNLTNALQVYEEIINSNAAEEEKYYAYQRKYSIGRLTGQSVELFNQLSNTFAILASNTQDSLNLKILTQFSTLSKVGEQEYETAIGEFDGIVQQNPNTEEAVYAEIDALTTALLIEEADSSLQKGSLGKYLVKSSANYHQRVDEILSKNFGSGSKENQKELLPTEYTLYQNYPNPFNPVTTIKYDLPFASEVSVVIYDILGRKIKELVNTKQQAGKYQVQFDASNLASGVYIYQLIAEKYMSSRKMILLK